MAIRIAQISALAALIFVLLVRRAGADDASAAREFRYDVCTTTTDESTVSLGRQLLQLDSAFLERKPQRSAPVAESDRSGSKHAPQHPAGKPHADGHHASNKSLPGRSNSAHAHVVGPAKSQHAASEQLGKKQGSRKSELPTKKQKVQEEKSHLKKSSKVEQPVKPAKKTLPPKAVARTFAVKRAVAASEEHAARKHAKASKTKAGSKSTASSAGKVKAATVNKGKTLEGHATSKKALAKNLKTEKSKTHLVAKSSHAGKLKEKVKATQKSKLKEKVKATQKSRAATLKAANLKAKGEAKKHKTKHKMSKVEQEIEAELEAEEEEREENANMKGTLMNPVIGSVVLLMSVPAGVVLLAFGAFLWVKSQEDVNMGAEPEAKD